MKVKCISITRENKPNRVTSLTLGKEYIVLSIQCYANSPFSNRIGDFTSYRLLDDDGVLVPYPAKLFKIVNNKLSSHWVASYKESGYFEILPQSWMTPGFFERYYNDDEESVSEFLKVKNLIYEEEINDF